MSFLEKEGISGHFKMSYIVSFISEQQHHRLQITQIWHRVTGKYNLANETIVFHSLLSSPSTPKTLLVGRKPEKGHAKLRLAMLLARGSNASVDFYVCDTWMHLPNSSSVCIYRACSGSSNWATVCLNTALRAKGNTDVSGLTRRCKNLFAPQRTHRLGWQIHVNTHVIKAAGRSDSGRCLGESFEWSWLEGDLREERVGQLMQEQVDPAECRYFPLTWWKHTLDSAH